MNRMTKEAAQAYQARWQLVARREIAETRTTSPTIKYRQFLELLRWAQALDWPSPAGEVEAVRRRWQCLRKAYRGQEEKRRTAS